MNLIENITGFFSVIYGLFLVLSAIVSFDRGYSSEQKRCARHFFTASLAGFLLIVLSYFAGQSTIKRQAIKEGVAEYIINYNENGKMSSKFHFKNRQKDIGANRKLREN